MKVLRTPAATGSTNIHKAVCSLKLSSDNPACFKLNCVWGRANGQRALLKMWYETGRSTITLNRSTSLMAAQNLLWRTLCRACSLGGGSSPVRCSRSSSSITLHTSNPQHTQDYNTATQTPSECVTAATAPLAFREKCNDNFHTKAFETNVQLSHRWPSAGGHGGQHTHANEATRRCHRISDLLENHLWDFWPWWFCSSPAADRASVTAGTKTSLWTWAKNRCLVFH